ncbi:MAG: hypothetical protein M1837_004399 [Sclerophora amabilis]|nr:MAG: hypothetical protein M1837_004399 [Sclerophora amabilis]
MPSERPDDEKDNSLVSVGRKGAVWLKNLLVSAGEQGDAMHKSELPTKLKKLMRRATLFRSRRASAGRAPVQTLPREVVLEILISLPDLRSLLNAMVIHPVAPRLYQSYHSHVFSSVISNTMAGEIQQLVSAVLYARLHRPETVEEVHTFLCFHFNENKVPLPKTLPDMWRNTQDLADISTAIEYFTHQFDGCNLENPATGLSGPFEMSHDEAHRVRRAFWRYQLYCECFFNEEGVTSLDDVEGRLPQQHMFLTKFLPWEIEELHCVYDFLYDLFEAAVQNHGPLDGPEWRARNPPRILRSWSSLRWTSTREIWTVYHLSCGLPYLSNVIQQSKESKRAKLLTNKSTFYFLPTAMYSLLEPTQLCEHFLGRRTLFRRLMVEQRHPRVYAPLERYGRTYPDFHYPSETTTFWSDTPNTNLPNAAWSSYIRQLPTSTTSGRPGLCHILRPGFRRARMWGFCMWDHQRLMRWGVLNWESAWTYYLV